MQMSWLLANVHARIMICEDVQLSCIPTDIL